LSHVNAGINIIFDTSKLQILMMVQL